jgi:thiol-disulfide isomerase/thioredoxin
MFKSLSTILAAALFALPAAHAAPLADKGAAPAFTGIDKWLNSDPLTMQQLRGKVVLVDFWTYSCINCLNTLPYVKQWHARYKDQGLAVVGVHTPEYSFERVTGNVAAAIKRLDIKYPVAQDNRYATWSAYQNRYWPALYLIDKKGRVVYSHFGEGDYAETEDAIRTLLAQPG